jgi:hypothetical protein
MQVQMAQDIRKVAAGQIGEFDLIRSNSAYRNATAIIYLLAEAASYTIRTYFDGVLYPGLNVTRTAERSVDILNITPAGRYMLPNIGPGLPGNFPTNNPLHEIPIRIDIANTGGADRVFYVGVTWEINPPGAGGGSY